MMMPFPFFSPPISNLHVSVSALFLLCFVCLPSLGLSTMSLVSAVVGLLFTILILESILK